MVAMVYRNLLLTGHSTTLTVACRTSVRFFLGGRGETLTTVILRNSSSQSEISHYCRKAPTPLRLLRLWLSALAAVNPLLPLLNLVSRAVEADFGVDGDFQIGC